MNHDLSRRDFLKCASILFLSPLLRIVPQPANTEKPNIILILHDALCALNLSLYDYPRQTSPNLERFSERATVFHNHHTAGNFTTPSTASLFTSTYPWTHRAFNISGLINPAVAANNLFNELKGLYHQEVFTQNIYVDMLLYQFEKSLGEHGHLDNYSLAGHTFYNHLFPKDGIWGMKSYDQLLFKREEAHGSLFLSILNDLGVQFNKNIRAEKNKEMYPLELPRLANTDVYFRMDQVTAGLIQFLDRLSQPAFVYLHLMPPHAPYTPARSYMHLFYDGWSPPSKKKHRLAPGIPQSRLDKLRRSYDQFIANLDAEFGHLMEYLEQSGLMENSYIIFTSDHGELFERGAHGHSMPLVFEPNIRVPLLIHAPGQQERQDIHSATSTVDLLPSLLKISGLEVPAWSEGELLPGFGGEETSQRNIYVIEAKTNPAYSPLRKATIAMMHGQYKLIHYIGYRFYRDEYEFYDLQNDPEEIINLYPSHPIAIEMKNELDRKLVEVNLPYMKASSNRSH